MALNKKKISDYPIADSLMGLWTLGYSAVDGIKKSFRVSLEFLKNAADRATSSAQSADTAAAAATSAAEGANTAAAAATSAAQDAENNVADVAELQSKVAVNADAIATNSARIAELQGRGGSIPAAAFGADDPASEGMQEAFTQYAAAAIWGSGGTFAWNSSDPAASTYTLADGVTVHTAAEIFNSTWTRNTDNGHRIVLNNTQDTDPAIYEWADVGVDTVNVATDTAAGIVLSDTPDGEFVVDPATGSVALAEQVATPGTIVENTTKFSSGVRKTLKAWMGDLFTKVNGLISAFAGLKIRVDRLSAANGAQEFAFGTNCGMNMNANGALVNLPVRMSYSDGADERECWSDVLVSIFFTGSNNDSMLGMAILLLSISPAYAADRTAGELPTNDYMVVFGYGTNNRGVPIVPENGSGPGNYYEFLSDIYIGFISNGNGTGEWRFEMSLTDGWVKVCNLGGAGIGAANY
ncbi:hypothetical protein [Alistipes sp.]|uniref:hypothetical protein n=1 Tax=Alistipes sp. TaxID=1872444 RepID=UPI0035275C02